MSVSLTATQCPLPVVPGAAVYMGEQYSPSGSPPTSLPQTSGNTAALASSILNRNSTGQDMASVYGAGGYGIGSGLALSVGTSLSPTVGKGQALCHGLVENTATAYALVANATATSFVWIKQDGSFVVQNGTTAKPSGNCLYIGACLANASAVTAIDTSGVVYYKGGQLWRETADSGAPGDSPDSTLRLFTKTAGGTYYWDGYQWNLLAGTKAARLLYGQSSVQAGDTVASTASETNFASKYNVPAGSLKVGDVIAVEARGVHSTTGTPTVEFKIKLGSVVLCATGAITTASGAANRGWYAKAVLTVVSIGASGSVEVQGDGAVFTAANAATPADMENTAVVTVDTTAAADLQASVTWSASSPSNTATMRSLSVYKSG